MAYISSGLLLPLSLWPMKSVQCPPPPMNIAQAQISANLVNPPPYFVSKSARAFCEIYVLARLGTGATGRTRGIIELSLQPPSFSLQSEFFSSDIYFFSVGIFLVHLESLVLNVHSILPGIAFSLHLIEATQKYGVSEVLLSSFMASFVFSVLGAQPLCIAGVTGPLMITPGYIKTRAHLILEGPITILNQTIFKILEDRTDSPDYLHFVGWVYLWGAIFHWVTAALNCQSLHVWLVALSVF
jgi:HCO3- transporter family